MRSRRFLFDVLTGAGHVTPTLPVVTELRSRGHEVDYATGPEHADAVTAAGARWVPLPALPPFHAPSTVDVDVLGRWLRHYFAGLRETYPVLRGHCATRPPDLLCYDSTNWPGRLVAAALDIPAAATFPHLASNRHFSLAAGMPAGDDPAVDALAGACAAFNAAHGESLHATELQDVPERLNLVFLPREFQPYGETFDERYVFAGPQLGDRERAAPWAPSDPDAPLLFVSLGSVLADPAAYRACIAAFGTGAWQVAMTVPDSARDELGPVPSTVDIQAFFPQPAVLRHAAAFVSHAGMNSTMEALYYGVPLIALPRTPEQEANARRIAELGLGVRLDPATVTAERLRTALGEVTGDRALRDRVTAMGAAIRAADGTARAADALLGEVRAQ